MKIFETVKLQLIIVVVLGLISAAITYVAFSSLATGGIALMAIPGILGLVSLAVVVWAGYVAAKTLAGGPVEGGLAGAIISVISGIISGIINLVLIMPLMLSSIPSTTTMTGLGLAAGMGPVSLVTGIIVGAIVGFILGAIGGFVGKGK